MDPDANYLRAREIRARIRAGDAVPGDHGTLRELETAYREWVNRGGFRSKHDRKSPNYEKETATRGREPARPRAIDSDEEAIARGVINPRTEMIRKGSQNYVIAAYRLGLIATTEFQNWSARTSGGTSRDEIKGVVRQVYERAEAARSQKQEIADLADHAREFLLNF
jgi:hypothetical protein